jgi:hypothetical protein
MLVDEWIYNLNGPNFGDGSCDFVDTPNPQGMPSGTVTAVAADNGYAGMVQPANNSASFFDMTGGTNSQPTVYTATGLGTTPWAIAMRELNGVEKAFVASADGTPSLYQVKVSNGTVQGPALVLTGVTPLSTVVAANLLAGGLYVVVLDSGPASGTVAVLSTYDQLLLLVDVNTWTITQSVKLSGTPFRITTDVAGGRVLVAFADPVNVQTTFAWVDALTGEATPSSVKSSLLSVGNYYDGKSIVSAMRDQIDLQPVPTSEQ